MEEKPFVFGTAVEGENFTDREKDCKRISANIKYGINTILISPRRWGKTSLVKKVAKEVESKDLRVVYLDIFSCRTPSDFYTRFADAIIRQTSTKSEEWLDNIKSFLLRFNPKFSMKSDLFSEMTLSLDILPKQEDYEELLSLPEKIAKKKNCRIVVCIDEFQQIGEFNDSLTFQKQLRTVWQHQQNVSYCLFGSKKHLMTELFANTSYPFYKFGDIIFLEKISTEDWIKYIIERFEETGKSIDRDLAEKICLKVENQSNYVQQLSWILWVNTEKEATEKGLKEAYEELLNHNSRLFERMTENLTAYQLNMLHAVSDGVHDEFTRQDILLKYKMGTSANIGRIKESLIKKDLIEISDRKVYIGDPVFCEWLRRIL